MHFRRCRNSLVCHPMEGWRIRSDWQFDRDDWAVFAGLVILFQPAPHLACLDAHYRIIARGVPRWPVEDLSTDRALFEKIWMTLQLLLYDIF